MPDKPAPPTANDRILVIKLGALGDIVLSLGPMQAIRAHHPAAHMTLLTRAPYVSLMAESGLFDDIHIDPRPRWTRPGDWLRFRRWLRGRGFSRVYDLQTSDRSCSYFHLLAPGPRPEWSGVARGCSHPHTNPDRNGMYTIARQAEQLAEAGITVIPPADMSWANADVRRFDIGRNAILMAPGGAPHRPGKRWPASHYAVLANTLADKGKSPVLIGTSHEAETVADIIDAAPRATSLIGKTSLPELAALARQAEAAIGNDTGPMHMIAAAGTPSVVVYSHDSDPACSAQCGPAVRILRRRYLDELSPAEVVAAMESMTASRS